MVATHAKIVSCATELVAFGGFAGGVAGEHLVLASSRLVEGFVHCREGRVVLELTISGGEGGKVDVRLVVQKRIEPSTMME